MSEILKNPVVTGVGGGIAGLLVGSLLSLSTIESKVGSSMGRAMAVVGWVRVPVGAHPKDTGRDGTILDLGRHRNFWMGVSRWNGKLHVGVWMYRTPNHVKNEAMWLQFG